MVDRGEFVTGLTSADHGQKVPLPWRQTTQGIVLAYMGIGTTSVDHEDSSADHEVKFGLP